MRSTITNAIKELKKGKMVIVIDDEDRENEGDLVYHGEKVGKHRGIPFYTVGQRKGLGVAMGKPVYVKKIDNRTNTVEIGVKEEINQTILYAEDVNYVSSENIEKGTDVIAKIRYNDRGSKAKVISANRSEFVIEFDDPKSAITPGQSAVLYDENGFVLAGGVISKGE